MASITERKDKDGNIISYVLRVYRGYDASGNRLKPFTKTWKPPETLTPKQIEKELNKRAVQFEEECANGGALQPDAKMVDFCKLYLETMKEALSPTTRAFYTRVIDALITPTLGALKLKDIRPAHVQQFIQVLAAMPKTKRNGEPTNDGATIAPATIQRYLTVLQSVFKLAVRLGYINETPAKAEKLTLPRIVAPKIAIFTKQEAAEMLSCLKNEDLQFQVMIQLAIFMGARRGELVALKFCDVDYDECKITIERAAIKLKGTPTQIKPPKDYEIRTVTVNNACIQLIQLLKEDKDRQAEQLGSQWVGGEWLFTQWNGEIMNPQTPTKQFSKFLEKNGLKHRKFHALRHTSATLLLYGGVNIKQVQSRLGHGDIETTNKYLHCVEEADAEAANILGNLLDVKREPKPPKQIRA